MLSRVEFEPEKFKELVLYIAQRSRDDDQFGRLKLAKLLMFADLETYAETRAPLTGATYRKKPYGPYALQLRDAERQLADEKRARLEQRPFFGKTQHRLVPSKDAEPNLSFFSEEDLRRVDRIIERYKHETGSYLSQLSHDAPGWRLARKDETIPYNTVFLSKTGPTDEDVRRGEELASSHGWQ